MVLVPCDAQLYENIVPDSTYHKIASGNMFYKATIKLNDSSKYSGYIARISDSNVIRFKFAMWSNDVYTMTDKKVASFTYLVEEFDYPKYIYKDISTSSSNRKIRPVEVIEEGKIDIYAHKWADNECCIIFTKFYFEKNNSIYSGYNIKENIKDLIKENKIVYKEFKKHRSKNIVENNLIYFYYIRMYNYFDKHSYVNE